MRGIRRRAVRARARGASERCGELANRRGDWHLGSTVGHSHRAEHLVAGGWEAAGSVAAGATAATAAAAAGAAGAGCGAHAQHA